MERMSDLVNKWTENWSDNSRHKNEEKQITRCGTSKEKIMIDSNFEQEGKNSLKYLPSWWKGFLEEKNSFGFF